MARALLYILATLLIMQQSGAHRGAHVRLDQVCFQCRHLSDASHELCIVAEHVLRQALAHDLRTAQLLQPVRSQSKYSSTSGMQKPTMHLPKHEVQVRL